MKKLLVTFLIDNSGSMANIKNDMEGSIETFLAEQKLNTEVETIISSFRFSNSCKQNLSFIPIDKLNNIDIVPSGSTALFDAGCFTIDKIGRDLDSMNEEERPEKVIFVIVTDGQENSSKEYTATDLKSRIEHQQSKYNWDFVFFGSNQDAIKEAAKIGISGGSSINYQNCTANAVGTILGAYTTRSVRDGKTSFLNDERVILVSPDVQHPNEELFVFGGANY